MSTQQPTSRLTALAVLVFLILAIIGWGPRIWHAHQGKKDLEEIRQTWKEIEKADAEFRKEMAKPIVIEE